jgi:hypothetical protein
MKNFSIVDTPKRWSDFGEAPDLRVTVRIAEGALKAIGLLLKDIKTRHG